MSEQAPGLPVDLHETFRSRRKSETGILAAFYQTKNRSVIFSSGCRSGFEKITSRPLFFETRLTLRIENS